MFRIEPNRSCSSTLVDAQAMLYNQNDFLLVIPAGILVGDKDLAIHRVCFTMGVLELIKVNGEHSSIGTSVNCI